MSGPVSGRHSMMSPARSCLDLGDALAPGDGLIRTVGLSDGDPLALGDVPGGAAPLALAQVLAVLLRALTRPAAGAQEGRRVGNDQGSL